MKKLYTALAFLTVLLSSSAFGQSDLVITEISYNPPESGSDSTEYIELFNNGSTTIDLSGYTFTSGVTYTFPTGVTLGAGNYLVVTVDSMAMVNTYGYIGAYQWTTGGLSNGGEAITLRDDVGTLMDTLRYDDVAPWPAGAAAGQPDGGGVSIVLCDPTVDNTDGANWTVSTTNAGINVNGLDVYGSPGALDNACLPPAAPALVITEINYNPAESGADSTEFIEIYNNDAATVDLTGYTFANGVTYTFPSGATIAPGNYVVVTVDSMAMVNTFGYIGAYQWTTGGLTNAGEAVSLETPAGDLVDSLTYDDFSPWPLSADGGGHSIVLCDPTSNNENGMNWVASSTSAGINVNGFDVYASPGAADACTPAIPDLIITEINYNGPESGADTTEFIEIYNNESSTVDLSGFSFSAGVTLTIPVGATVPAGGYLVVCEDSMAMVNAYSYSGAYRWTSGALGNGGEAIALVDRVGQLVDTVFYDDLAPWPTGFAAGEPDGGGASIILCDVLTDNNDGSNWSAASTAVGVAIAGMDLYASPGAANVCPVVVECPSSFSATACDSYTVPSGDETYTISGVYMDTIAGLAGCDSVMTITVTINASSVGSETITACDAYTWPTNSMTYTTSGAYTETLTNAVGCDSVVTLNLTINSTPAITTTTSGVTISSDASGVSYQWLDCDNGDAPLSGETNQSFTATTNGNYAVEVSSNGCIDTSACVNIASVNILENSFASALNVYPNPTSGKIFIEFTDAQSATVALMNISGEVIERKMFSEHTIITYEVEQPAGVYFLEVTNTNNEKAVIRVIKY